MSETSYQAVQTDLSADLDVNRPRFDSSYVKCISGKLKILEIILCLLVFMCATIAVRNYAVFYGCAVWGSVMGFLCMVVSTILLIAHCYHNNASCPTFEIVYCAFSALSFLIAGVMLAIVADAAISIPRGELFRSSLIGDQLNVEEIEVLGTVYHSQGKIHWLIQTTPANAHEFRAAVCAAVFSFIVTLVFAMDTRVTHSERRRRSASVNTSTRYKPSGKILS